MNRASVRRAVSIMMLLGDVNESSGFNWKFNNRMLICFNVVNYYERFEQPKIFLSHQISN